jgi:predicted  nucleic acid-binding Zn-ribbon protein
VDRLEAQLKQAPSRDELSSTRQQAEKLRGQLGQATEQLRASQDRVGRLEAQLKQALSRNERTLTQQQAETLRGQLGQATEQLKASQDRVGQLEAQLKQAPSRIQQEAKSNSAGTSTTPSCEAVGCSFALSPRADPGAAGR